MRIMVVDDDQGIRDYIAELEEWQQLGCKITGKASNGVDALALMDIATPDVIITDIMMPLMSGIELVEELRSKHIDIPIIYLTAYNEFEYAKKAIKLGVYDFITKPFLPKDLTQCIEMLKIHRKTWGKSVDHHELFEYLSQPNLTIEQKQEWLQVNGITDQPFVLLYADLDFHPEFNDKVNFSFSQRIFNNSIAEVIQQNGYQCLIAPSRNGLYILLFFTHESEDQIKYLSMRMAKQIVSIVRDDDEYSYSVGISDQLPSLLELQTGIRQINECVEYRMLMGRKSIIAFHALKKFKQERKKEEQVSLDQLEDKLRVADLDNVIKLLRSAYRNMLINGTSKKEMQHFCIRVIEKSEFYMEQLGIKLSSIEKVEIRENLLSHQVLTDLMKSLEEKLIRDILMIRNQQEKSTSRHIIETKKIIETEYNQELTLQMIAKRINVNYSYLSRIIKLETGKNFIELLWEHRIETAKKLLIQNHRKNYEIAYDVGFKDPAHFNYLFKKKVGISPGAYRDQIIK